MELVREDFAAQPEVRIVPPRELVDEALHVVDHVEVDRGGLRLLRRIEVGRFACATFVRLVGTDAEEDARGEVVVRRGVLGFLVEASRGRATRATGSRSRSA